MLIFQSLLGAEPVTSSPVVVSPSPLYAWGVNTTGKLGINNNTTQSYHVQVQSGTSWKSFSTAFNHSLGVKADGTLWAWGDNGNGQLGTGVASYRRTDLEKLDNSSWTVLKIDGNHYVGIKPDGSLWTWGNNDAGQLGVSDVVKRSSPVQVGTSSWTAVDTGAAFTVAIKVGGTLWAWGRNTTGQYGNGTTVSRSSPVQIGALTTWSKISAGSAAVIASTTDNMVYVWGSTADGNLALSVNDSFPRVRSSPVVVAFQPFDGVIDVASGFQNTLLIDNQYRLWGWGRNDGFGSFGAGYLANNSTVGRSSPILISSTGSWTSLSSNGFHYLAIKSDGSLWSWGWNSSGQLGTNDSFDRSSPVQIGTSSWTMVSAGNQFSTAINADGRLFCWGQGTLGSVGNNSALNRSSPIQIATTSSFNFVSAGYAHGLARTINNKLWAWGYNNDGQVGDGTKIWRSSPVAIGTTTSWIAIGAGSYHSGGVKSGGTLWMWGINNVGQLGNSSTISRSSPIQVGALTTWTKVSGGGYHTLAMTESAGVSTVYHFGQNLGAAGNGTTANTSAPVSVYSATGTSKIIASTNINASLIVTPDGTLIGSGENTAYALGLVENPTANTNVWKILGHSPPGTINSVAMGHDGASIVANNVLWSFGLNNYGQYMNGFAATRSRAVIADSSKTWSSVKAGYYARMGITSDGALWSSGYNVFGQLGVGDLVNRSSPTQVGTSSWTMVDMSAVEQPYVAGVTSDGKLWGWGRNYLYIPLGALGDIGSYTNRSAPVQLGTATNYTSVSVEGQQDGVYGYAVIAGVNSLGEAYWQGYGVDFAINDANKISPVQVGTDTDWEYVSAGGGVALLAHSLAIKTNKTLWSWGSDYWGNLALGIGIGSNRSSPTQVTGGPTNGSWSAVAGGYNFDYGIDTSGKLWAWGYNYTGGGLGLGVGVATYYTAPQLVTKQRSFTFLELGRDNVQTGALAIDSLNNEYWSWGGGTMGLGGMQTTTVYSSPSQLPSTGWKAMSIGTSHTVGLKTDGSLWAWGHNLYGQLGTNSTIATITPTQLVVGSSFTAVAAGDSHSAAVDVAGRLYVWGFNSTGQLGINSLSYRSSPTVIATDKSWTSVGAGNALTAAITSTGDLWAWGSNTYGQLGVNDDTYVGRSSPVQVAGATNVTKVRVGFQAITYVDSSSRAYFIGHDFMGMSARGTSIILTEKQMVPFRETINNMGGSWNMVAVSGDGTTNNATSNFGAGIKSDGSLWTWGGAIGLAENLPASVDRPNSAKKIGNSSWSFVAAAVSTGAAIDANGRLFTWGSATSGKTAVGDLVTRSSPVQVAGSWSLVTLGEFNGAGIQTNGTLWVWGSGSFGKMGDNTTIGRSSPVQVAGTWTSIALAGRSGSAYLGIKGGQVYAWGGQTATNYLTGGITTSYASAAVSRSSPVVVSLLTYDGISATAIAAGTLGALAYRLSDGTLWTWGDNAGGALGINDNAQAGVSFPTILAGRSWLSLSVGVYNVVAVRSDGTLWAWGENTYGQLGLNDTIDRSSPVQVGSLTNWAEVSVGQTITMAKKNDGTLWMWGWNFQGQLGDGTTVSKSSPIQIGTSSWTAISAGSVFCGAISGVRLFTWGENGNGRLGLSDNISRSSPVQVGTSSWVAVAAGFNHMMAIRATNRSLFSLGGDNSYGQLGLSNTINRSSPVQVGTSSWSAVSAGYYGTMGITTAGSLWTWGSNGQGRLGVGDDKSRSAPTQVGALTDWTDLGRSQITEVNTALRGNDLYAMGSLYNLSGAEQNRSSPVLVGVGNWRNVHTSQYTNFAIYNNSLILTEGYDFYNWTSSRGMSLGGNSTTTNAWNTSSRVFMESTRGHRAWDSNIWSNNITIGGTFKATKTDGTLWTWGTGSQGTIGDGASVNRSSPVQVGTDTDWYNGSSGVKFYQTFAANAMGEFKSDGTVYGWGSTSNYANMVVSSIQSPVQITGSWTIVGPSKTSNFYMGGVKTNGTLWTWGQAVVALGLGEAIDRSSPTQVGTKTTWTDVVTGGINRMGAIGDSGQTVYVWGSDLGAWSQTSSSSPVALFADNFGAKAVYPSMLGSHTMVLSTDSSLYAIGTQKNGVFGDNGIMGSGVADPSGHIPRKIENGTWKAIATGNSHTLGLKTNGTLWAWGLNSSGQLGINDSINRSSPVQVMAGKSFTNISAGALGWSHAVDQNGIMWGFGNPTGGVLGISSASLNRSYPVQVGERWSSISSGQSHVMLIDSEGGLWGWGDNTFGQLATNDVTSRGAYTKIGNSSWSMVSAGDDSVHAIAVNGTLWAWGSNINGNLGLNDTINRSSPTQVGNGSWLSVNSRETFTLAIDSLGKLWAWGNNSAGTLGDGTTTNRLSPVQVAGVGQTSSFSVVRAGVNVAVAITINGELYAWGVAEGTGQNSSVNRSQPVLVSSDWTTNQNKVTVNQSNVIAIKSDGTIWSWGGASAVMGRTSTTARSSPTQIGTSSWTFVSAASSRVSRASAIDVDGKAFAWGSNTAGTLGTGDTLSRSSPVLITGSRSWSVISHVASYTTAIESGTRDRYIWGAPGTFTGLGSNPGTRSDPTFIAEGRVGSWVTVNAGYDSVLATKTE